MSSHESPVFPIHIVGTAGHVDHGKSTLVRALTGIDPDRLKEEKEREMTIDLGFAWLTLPSGRVVSIVDVPGHEAFIKNMLAGVGGIDAALFVIAADEGIMPQTREHLAILDLLHIQGGLIALTKADLVDADWLDLVTQDVRTAVKDSALKHAPIIPVSAKTGAGLKELVAALDQLLAALPPRANLGHPRLPIDRVFTIAGFGTVVTGTLTDGELAVGEEVEILPGRKRARIRGLQTHKEKKETAAPGSRVAINLSGVTTEEIQRGELVTRPSTFTPTRLLDVRLTWLASTPKPVKHNDALDFFAFTFETPAHVRLLDAEEIKPGASAWAQLALVEPVALAKGDRFILRYPSPSLTVGGGLIVDANPTARHRRFRADVLARLETRARGTPSELVQQQLAALGPSTAREIAKSADLDLGQVESALKELEAAGLVLGQGTGAARLFFTRAGWQTLAQTLGAILDDYHAHNPLRAGMSREELKSRLGLAPRVFDAILARAADEQILRVSESLVARPHHTVTFPPALQRRVDALFKTFAGAPFTPPSFAEAEEQIGADALNALIEQNRLVKLNEATLFTPEAFEQMRAWVVATIRTSGQVTAAEVRDHFGTSRKYAIALLEYLDEKKTTARVGDARVLRSR